jgi:selenide,water dikinase
MVRDSETDMVFLRDRIPVLDGVTEMVGASMVPEGAYGNLRFLQGRVDFPDDMPEDERLVLCDPQTSGGLLITLREEGLGRFAESSVYHAVVGHVVKGTGRIRVR